MNPLREFRLDYTRGTLLQQNRRTLKILLNNLWFRVKGSKYMYEGAAPKKMYKNFGKTEDFEALIKTNPKAFQQFRYADAASIAGIGATLLMVAASANMLAGTIKDAQDVQSGSFPNEERSVRDTGFVIASAGLVAVCMIFRLHYVTRGVKLFNAGKP